MKSKNILSLISAIAIGILLPIRAESAVVLKLPLEKMVSSASMIIRGKVIKKYSVWDKKDRRIYTYITLEIIEKYKGKVKGKTVTIRQLGGKVGNIGMMVPGAPKFKLGEESILFLHARKDQTYPMIMGLSYGKYRIVKSAKLGKPAVERNLSGITLARMEGQKLLLERPGSKKTLIPLEEFVKKIKTYLKTKEIKPKTPLKKVERATLKK